MKNPGRRTPVPIASSPSFPSTHGVIVVPLKDEAAPVNTAGAVVGAARVDVVVGTDGGGAVAEGAAPLRDVVACVGVEKLIVALKEVKSALAWIVSVALTETVVIVVT